MRLWRVWIAAVMCGLLWSLPVFAPATAPVTLAGTFGLAFALSGRMGPGWRIALAAGALAGLTYALPVLSELELGWLASLPVAGICVALFSTFGLLCRLLRGRAGDEPSPLLAGCVLALLDCVVCDLLSPWGRALSLSRMWGEYPQAVAFIRITGIYGITFLLFYLPAALAIALHWQTRRKCNASGMLLALGLILAACHWFADPLPPAAPVAPVAPAAPAAPTNRQLAVGIVGTIAAEGSQAEDAKLPARLRKEYPAVTCLLVFPETHHRSTRDDLSSDPYIRSLRAEAMRHRMTIALGVDWRAKNGKTPHSNIQLGIAPEGTLTVYQKSHLLPGERYEHGPGAPAVLPGADGGMLVCNDDNFMDWIAQYARLPVSVLIAPANDWPQVARLHQQSAVLRALESGLPLVRATRGGYSAIIDSRGQTPVLVPASETESRTFRTALLSLPAAASWNARHPYAFLCACVLGGMAILFWNVLPIWRRPLAQHDVVPDSRRSAQSSDKDFGS